ncbi:MAG: 30S ribosomal protein S6--L-glutamate ligase [Bacteroidota bacterium]
MNIIILSRKPKLYSTNRLREAGRERGHQMFILDHLLCNILIEKNHPQIIYRKINIKNIHAIIPRIGASVNFHGAAVIRQFEMMNVFTTTSSEALLRARNKLKSLQLLSQSGLELPKTIFTNYSSNVNEVLDAVGGAPVVIKLLEGTQGLGVVLAETKSTAKSLIEAFYSLKARIIVQEFIKEAKGVDIRAFVVDGQVVAAMKRVAGPGEFRSNLHRGGSAKAISLGSKQEETAIMAAKVMGLGIAGVDMLQSRRGPLILEVNPSPGLEGIEKSTGVDIAGKIIDYIEKNAE